MAYLSGLACRLVAMLLPMAAAASPPPLAAYAHRPLLDWISLAPDGTKYAALLQDDSKYEFQVIDLRSGEPLIAAAFTSGSIAGVSWAGPGHLVVTRQASNRTRSDGLRRALEAHHLDIATRTWTPLLRNSNTLSANIWSPATARIVDGVPTAFVNGWSYNRDDWMPVVGKINLITGAVGRSENGNKFTTDWILDTTGRAVGREDFDPASCTWKLWGRAATKAEWRVLETAQACIDYPREGGLGRNDNEINMRKKVAEEWRLLSIDLGTGDQRFTLPAASDGIFFDSFDGRMIGYLRHSLESVTIIFYDEADQKVWRSIAKAFPGEQVSFLQRSADHQIILVSVEGQTSGLSYFAVDRLNKSAKKLADAFPGIEASAVSEQRAIRYKAADGLEIPAYLTLPRGRTARGLPMVVLTATGEFNGPGFDWIPQALASRGYAVLQPFARGSTGLGAPLRDSGVGQFMAAVETDQSDGVHYLVGTGIIDGGRVCIVGQAANAHVALASAARAPSLYRCAAGIMGVYDLRKYLQLWDARSTNGREPAGLLRWKSSLGVASIDDPKLASSSPRALAAKLQAPVLLIDTKNYPQGDAMEDALREAGKPPTRLQLTGEAMWDESNAERIRVIEALASFLETHNPPDPAPVK